MTTTHKGTLNVDWAAVRQDAAATLSRYIQFDTTNPPGNELPAAEWLRDQLIHRGVSEDVTIYQPAAGRGLLLARIPGSEPLKPLLITHHIDVVAVDPGQWTHPPFSGTIADGFVWGRGALDTKNLGVLYLLALELLIKEGVRFRRPLIFLAVPDEETGGEMGMRWLLEQHLAELDPEWVWDEGSGGLRGVFGEGVAFGVAVVEKQIRQLRLTARGEPGHGSMPHGNNANVTLLRALGRMLRSLRPLRLHPVATEMFQQFAKGQKFPISFLLRHMSNPLLLKLAARRLSADKMLNALLRDTISLTRLQAGYKVNVIPEQAVAELDCRLLPDTDPEEFQRWVRSRLADERVELEVILSSPHAGETPRKSPYYEAIQQVVERHLPGAVVFPLLVPGGTDGRYFREQGYPAYGFAPVLLELDDISRVHGIDERISIDNLELGVKMTRDMIRKLCV
jgi:acetylornithine deacetylase/succinyl-diaminopimelate desuccinylase-like protein